MITVLNAGSSSVKFSVFIAPDDGLGLALRGQVESIGTAPRFTAQNPDGTTRAARSWDDGAALGHAGAVGHIIQFIRDTFPGQTLLAVGHRVVHGGAGFSAPVRVDAEVLGRLERLVPLAPLHQPHNLAAIRLLLEDDPRLSQVACFDTAFHRGQPELAQMFALPMALHDEGVRRYGFHGLSYEYIASRLAALDARAAAGRTIVLHLGNGASMCALRGSRSIATTMGFSTVDGLPMGTRSGSVDPGAILYLMDARGLDVRAIEDLIYHQSGLLGVSGISGDMRTLLASDEARARLAVDLYLYRIGRELGSLAAALGGLDALVFTGGIGENSAQVRARVCQDAAWLGVELDAVTNGAGGPRITTPSSSVTGWTIPANEELMIARHTLRLLRNGP